MRICLVFLTILAATLALDSCFVPVDSTDRRDAISVSLASSQPDCSGLCESNNQCEAYSFNASSNKCVLLGARQEPTPSGSCTKPYAIHEKCTTSTSTPTTTTTTKLGGWKLLTSAPAVITESPTIPITTASSTTTTTATPSTSTTFSDPCIAQSFPELTVNETRKRPCPMRNPDGSEGPLLVVRAVTASGETVTLANMVMSGMSGGLRRLYKREVAGNSEYVAASSFVCASVDNAKCPCARMPPPTHPDARCASSPAFGASPCTNKFWYSDGYDLTSEVGSDTYLICNDGVYILYYRSNFFMKEVVKGCCGA